MREKHEHTDDEPITFTLGTGNQSAICGGVKPMGVAEPQLEAEAESREA